MKMALERRVTALEEWQARWKRPVESMPTFEAARRILATMREGANAKEELAAANGSLDPARRAKLTNRVEVARSIAATLAKQVEPLSTREVTPWLQGLSDPAPCCAVAPTS